MVPWCALGLCALSINTVSVLDCVCLCSSRMQSLQFVGSPLLQVLPKICLWKEEGRCRKTRGPQGKQLSGAKIGREKRNKASHPLMRDFPWVLHLRASTSFLLDRSERAGQSSASLRPGLRLFFKSRCATGNLTVRQTPAAAHTDSWRCSCGAPAHGQTLPRPQQAPL